VAIWFIHRSWTVASTLPTVVAVLLVEAIVVITDLLQEAVEVSPARWSSSSTSFAPMRSSGAAR
jgi:hypothetical protein